jgi:hypothetical protein
MTHVARLEASQMAEVSGPRVTAGMDAVLPGALTDVAGK